MNIEIENLTKSYGDRGIFRDYNLTIKEHGILVIMGSSGAGKTTLLHLMAGLEHPDVGTITGIPEKIGMVFQEDRLCEEFSAVENVRLVLSRVLGGEKGKTEQKIRDHLMKVGIPEENMERPVSEYSGGMKRRVALVRAMMADAELLLLDEPCTGLDEDTKKQVMKYILEQRRNRTMVVVTHSEEEAGGYGGELLLLK